MDSLPGEIRISVMISTGRLISLNANTMETVMVLKSKIFRLTKIGADNQCLIFRGQVLADNQILGDYRVSDGQTMNLCQIHKL